MPPTRKTKTPRSYGRQADGRTIKSLSLTADVAAWAEEECKAVGISFSSFIERIIAAAKAQTEAYDAKQNIVPMPGTKAAKTSPPQKLTPLHTSPPAKHRDIAAEDSPPYGASSSND